MEGVGARIGISVQPCRTAGLLLRWGMTQRAKPLKLTWIAAFVITLMTDTAQAQDAKPPPLKCETGPVHRQYGGTDWVVYSCNDEQTMVVVSAAGNPAGPFYFLLSRRSGTYAIYGEGNGSKTASKAAGDELSQLSQATLADLLAATKETPNKH